jgi:stage V sporulation protein B
LLPKIIVSVTFPMLSRSAHVDRAAVSRLYKKTTVILWAAALPICIGVSMAAEPMILATAGPKFVEAALPLKILIWATAFIFINAQLRFMLTALDAERTYWRLICWALAIKVALEAVLIPIWGLYGACIGNLLGEIVLCGGGMAALRRFDVRGPALTHYMRSLPAAAVMTAVMWPFARNDSSLVALAVAGVVASVLYVIVCIIAGVFPWSEVKKIWAAVRRPVGVSGLEPIAVVAVAETADAIPG